MKKMISVLLATVLLCTSSLMSFASTAPLPSGMQPQILGFIEKDGKQVLSAKLPSFYSTKSTIQARNASTGWKDYSLQSTGLQQSNANLGNHPAFDSLLVKQAKDIVVSSSSTANYSVALTYGPVTVTYAPASAGGAVFSNKFFNVCKSKVVLIGDLTQYTYQVKEYSGAGMLIRTYTEKHLFANNTFPGFVGQESPYMNVLRY